MSLRLAGASMGRPFFDRFDTSPYSVALCLAAATSID